jgi:hypothetical protein
MIEKKRDIPRDALRPYKNQGKHYAQCQAFALARRDKLTVAMLLEDNWCPAPVIVNEKERGGIKSSFFAIFLCMGGYITNYP